MSTQSSINEKIMSLTPDQQREVMEFVEPLKRDPKQSPTLRSLMGMFSHLDNHMSEEDIGEARREMWSNQTNSHLNLT